VRVELLDELPAHRADGGRSVGSASFEAPPGGLVDAHALPLLNQSSAITPVGLKW
jgi:hypothetical protein